MTYLIWKCLHILAVVVFLGNIGSGLFWAAQAHRSRDARLIAATFCSIERSDRWFTIPGVVGIVVSGIAMAMSGGFPILSTGWIIWPIGLFTLSGVVFGVWVAPLQRRIYRDMEAATSVEAVWSGYTGMYRRWELWGLLALLAPFASALIMILKPALPAL
jgi:uncharacterized membrane protein